MTLVVISLDRCLALVMPFQYKRGIPRKHCQRIMMAVWALAVLLGTIPLMPVPYFTEFFSRSSVCVPLYLSVRSILFTECCEGSSSSNRVLFKY